MWSLFLIILSVLVPELSCANISCLICDVVPAVCTFSPLGSSPPPPIIDTTSTLTGHVSCVANTTECEPTVCGGNEVCQETFFNFNTTFATLSTVALGEFDSRCIAIPCDGLNLCLPIEKDVSTGETLPRNRVECCCGVNNCNAGNEGNVTTEYRVVRSIASPSTDGTSPSTTSTDEAGSEVALTIGVGVIAALLFLGLLVIAVICLIYCTRRLLAFKHTLDYRNRTAAESGSYNVTAYSEPPWELQGRVGQGRFGHVYKAFYQGEIVALKVYSHHNRTAWENERNLFSLESTRHNNIVNFIDSSESRGTSPLQLFLLTTYYSLGSLEDYLRARTVSWDQACTIASSIARGLKHLHSEVYLDSNGISTEKYSIAHRDMKSSNVLVKSEAGDCVIGDLGLALQLIPVDNPKEIGNYGQVGTLRYMSPEALEGQVNLLDLQTFKQIDIYAFSLVMWEVLSRCCVLTVEEVEPYQLPFANVVVHPSLEVMKDIVCTRQLRPPIPAVWSNCEPLSSYTDIVQECWDVDPEARLTAANILHQLNTLATQPLPNIEDHTPHSLITNHTPLQQSFHTSHPATTTAAGAAASNGRMELVLVQEHSQSSPPPCYSPTDPVRARNQENCRQRRGYNFQSSLPHISQAEGGAGGDGDMEIFQLPPRYTGSLRSSATLSSSAQQQQQYQQQFHSGQCPPFSVRNSLILSRGRNSNTGMCERCDEILPTFADSCDDETSSVSENLSCSIPSLQSIHETAQAENSDSLLPPPPPGPLEGLHAGSKEQVLNTDSGIQLTNQDSICSQSTLQSEGSALGNNASGNDMTQSIETTPSHRDHQLNHHHHHHDIEATTRTSGSPCTAANLSKETQV